jgi:hypothetical protein
MNSCEKHDYCIVVYTGRDCPACSLDDEIKVLKEGVETLDTLVDEKDGEIAALNEQIENMEDKVNH